MPYEPSVSRWTYGGLFMIALATLMQEILLTRLFSVTMWYHFAFVAISLAMFGMTVGALIVYLCPDRFPPEATKRQLTVTATLFPVALVFSFLTQLSIPFRVHPSIVAIYAIVFTYAVIAVPFVLSGICICLALTRFPTRVGQLYAADLLGAALGCILVIAVLEVTDGPTAVIVIGCFAAVGAVFFSIDSRDRLLRNAATFIALTLGVFAAGHTILVWKQFPILRILHVAASFEARPVYERWNSHSRVRVYGNADALEPPYGWGLSSTYPADRKVHQLHMDIDVAAGTVLTRRTGEPGELDHLQYDVTNVGYYIRPTADVLIVGAGGGRDALSALTFGAKSVVAVELNQNIIETVNGRFGAFTGHIDREPRVTFVNDEARSWVARQERRFDFIQISLIDTWAATAAGAFVLSENSLYTTEAWRVLLDKLTPSGVLSVSRWFFEARPGEVYRLASLGNAVLRERGVRDPRRHIVIIRNVKAGRPGERADGVGTLLVSPTPFTSSDLARLEAESERLAFDIVLSPEKSSDPVFAQLATAEDVGAFADSFPINISPPTDNSPFFFQMLRFRDLFNLDRLREGASMLNMQAVFVLGVLLFTVLTLTALCIVGPLLLTAQRAPLDGATPLLVFFAGIGLGFMLVEISQMQRLIVLLGHPTYALSVVLFTLLVASGVGSSLTQHVSASTIRRAGVRRLAILVGVLVVFGGITPHVVAALEGATTLGRVAASAAILFPAGLLMGMAFPLGMRVASGHPAALTPWLWGINGATSVCASVLAIAIALWSGISTAFWTGVACYVVSLVAFLIATRDREAAGAAERYARSTASMPLAGAACSVPRRVTMHYFYVVTPLWVPARRERTPEIS